MERIVRCPECGKDSIYSSENKFRPFCSERCRLIDLGAWASGTYSLPTETENSEESPAISSNSKQDINEEDE